MVRKLGWRLENGILKGKELLVRNFVENTKFNTGINVCHNKELHITTYIKYLHIDLVMIF